MEGHGNVSTWTKLSKTALAAAAVGTLALTGCGSGSGGGGSGDEGGGSDPGSLSIFWKGSESAGIDAAVAAYTEANPDVDIEVTTADVEQYQSTLRTQLSAGSAADVVFVWPARGNPATIAEIAPGGYLEDLSDRDWAANYPDTIRDLTSIDGKVYLMAPAISSWGPWYNQNALEEAGLTPPSQWSDVIPFCEDARAAGKVAYAIGAATPNANQNILFGLVPDLVYATNPDFGEQIRAGETTFSDEPGWVEAMDRFGQMNEAGCFNDDATGANQEEQNRLVASGEATGYFGIATQLAAMADLAPDVEFRITPFSGDDDPATDLMVASNAGGAAVNSASGNKDAAFAFVDWLGSAEGLEIYNDALAGTVPSIPTGEDYEDINLAVTSEYVADGRTVPFLDQDWPNPRIQQAMFSGVQGMLAGSQTSEDVLAAMDAELG
jgi:raffinose/stachyose/melibiose transport system substrate-binding protein